MPQFIDKTLVNKAVGVLVWVCICLEWFESQFVSHCKNMLVADLLFVNGCH